MPIDATTRRLTVAECAERLRCAPAKVLAMIRAGRLRALNVGMGSRRPRWVIDLADLERWENSRANAPAPVAAPRRRARMEQVPNYFG